MFLLLLLFLILLIAIWLFFVSFSFGFQILFLKQYEDQMELALYHLCWDFLEIAVCHLNKKLFCFGIHKQYFWQQYNGELISFTATQLNIYWRERHCRQKPALQWGWPRKRSPLKQLPWESTLVFQYYSQTKGGLLVGSLDCWTEDLSVLSRLFIFNSDFAILSYRCR